MMLHNAFAYDLKLSCCMWLPFRAACIRPLPRAHCHSVDSVKAHLKRISNGVAVHRQLQFAVHHPAVCIRASTSAADRGSPSPANTSSVQTMHHHGGNEVQNTINLNDEERELLGTLLEAAKAANTNTVLRCAGGWVRDKLLGRTSNDIDVALDNMLGRDFADVVNTHLKSQGKESRHTAVIESNPDQSKHLETARMKVNDLWVDLVNLRSETYAQDSRIPQMEFGTPEQDALRRDFTINSMFYNINDGTVEDLTGKGMDDLRAGIIRTPLHPMETFLDDPLRVLRAVRFGTRFGFELEQTLVEAASNEKVCAALAQKVSKERVGAELEGMFNGPAPVASVQLLDRLNLFHVVFSLPAEQQRRLSGSGSACSSCMQAASDLAASLELPLDKEDRRFLLMAALLLPYRHMQVPAAKGKTVPASSHIIRESIKWRIKDAEMTSVLHATAEELQSICQQLTASEAGAAAPESIKVALGLAIRKLKQHWRLGVVLAPILALKAAAPLGVDSIPSPPSASSPSAEEAAAAAGQEQGELGEAAQKRRLEQAHVLLSAAAAFGLEDCWQWKPLMDGKQVMSFLGLKKAGPELGQILASVIEWQLAHPNGTLEHAQQHLKQTWAK